MVFVIMTYPGKRSIASLKKTKMCMRIKNWLPVCSLLESWNRNGQISKQLFYIFIMMLDDVKTKNNKSEHCGSTIGSGTIPPL